MAQVLQILAEAVALKLVQTLQVLAVRVSLFLDIRMQNPRHQVQQAILT